MYTLLIIKKHVAWNYLKLNLQSNSWGNGIVIIFIPINTFFFFVLNSCLNNKSVENQTQLDMREFISVKRLIVSIWTQLQEDSLLSNLPAQDTDQADNVKWKD